MITYIYYYFPELSSKNIDEIINHDQDIISSNFEDRFFPICPLMIIPSSINIGVSLVGNSLWIACETRHMNCTRRKFDRPRTGDAGPFLTGTYLGSDTTYLVSKWCFHKMETLTASATPVCIDVNMLFKGSIMSIIVENIISFPYNQSSQSICPKRTRIS